MKVEAPSRYAGAFVTGLTRSGGAERPHAAVIIKAVYDLIEAGPNSRLTRPRPAPDPIVFSDQGGTFKQIVEGKSVPRFDVTYEADIALEKARADIIVEGWTSPDQAAHQKGAVLVNRAVWMTRGGFGSDRDAGRNLFGWQPRGVGARKPPEATGFTPTPEAQLPPGYTPAFNNAHRRGGTFDVTGAISQDIARDAEIEIHESANHSDANPLRVSLTLPSLSARYRSYCGHGPDKPHTWAITDLPWPRLDTLVLRPEDQTLTALWRTGFDPSATDPSAYRAIQIAEEVA